MIGTNFTIADQIGLRWNDLLPQTQSYVDAGNITNWHDQQAANDFLIELKATTFEAKIQAAYLLLGSLEGARYNIINSNDYRTDWFNGMLWDDLGIDANGIAHYGDTNYLPSTDATIDDTHLGAYLMTNSSDSGADIGAVSGGGSDYGIYGKWTDNTHYMTAYGTANEYTNQPMTDPRGMLFNSRVSNIDLKGYQEGNIIGTHTAPRTKLLPTKTLTIARTNGTNDYRQARYGFFTIGKGLTSSEVATYTDIIHRFLIKKGRKVV